MDSHGVSVRGYDRTVFDQAFGEFPAYHLALLTYWLNLLLLGITLYFSWVCAEETGVVKEELAGNVARAIKRRILIGQWLYALGALLSIVSTYASIAFIVCVQLNYAVAPRFTQRGPVESLEAKPRASHPAP